MTPENSHLTENFSPAAQPASAAWLCADQYYQVLLSYLVCNRHFAPQKARKILQNFYQDQFVKDKFEADSHKAGVCFRVLTREAMDLYLYEKCYETHSEKRYQPLDNLPSDPFFDRQWARETINEAMRRVREVFTSEGEPDLFQSLLDDLRSKPYKDRPGDISMRERYRDSEKAKQYFIQQLESLLLTTISDSRLAMQEWQALQQILPEALAFDPEIVTQHFLSPQDMNAFWLELQSETIPGLKQSFREILENDNTTLEDLQKTRQMVKSQNPGNTLPLELLEALLYSCLAVELLKFSARISDSQKRCLPRGLFWLSKQQWLDPRTLHLATQAEKKIQHLTARM